MNTERRVIKGHCNLELIVGNLYDIHYGINQGVYEYLGQETEGFLEKASKFKNIENGNIFRYFGLTTPYEFTSIVSKHE